MIYYNNGFKRVLDVEVSPGVFKAVSVYSITKKILNPDTLERINELEYSNFQFTQMEASIINIRPMITNRSGNFMYGQVMEQDLNYHQLISGDSRSGKSKYESEQAKVRYEETINNQ